MGRKQPNPPPPRPPIRMIKEGSDEARYRETGMPNPNLDFPENIDLNEGWDQEATLWKTIKRWWDKNRCMLRGNRVPPPPRPLKEGYNPPPTSPRPPAPPAPPRPRSQEITITMDSGFDHYRSRLEKLECEFREFKAKWEEKNK